MARVIESSKQAWQDKFDKVCARARVKLQNNRKYWGDAVFREDWIFGRTICGIAHDWSALVCTRSNLSRTKQIATELNKVGINPKVIIHPDPIWHSHEYTEKKAKRKTPKATARCQSCGALATSAAICPYCHAPRRR